MKKGSLRYHFVRLMVLIGVLYGVFYLATRYQIESSRVVYPDAAEPGSAFIVLAGPTANAMSYREYADRAQAGDPVTLYDEISQSRQRDGSNELGLRYRVSESPAGVRQVEIWAHDEKYGNYFRYEVRQGRAVPREAQRQFSMDIAFVSLLITVVAAPFIDYLTRRSMNRHLVRTTPESDSGSASGSGNSDG